MNDDIMTRTFCVEFTDFPKVDEAWLEGKARAIGKALFDRLGSNLEWGQVVTLPKRSGIGLALLFAEGYEHAPAIAETIFEIVCEHTDIVLPKSGRGKPSRKDGLPRFGLGPRFPAEFYASHGRIRPVSPVIHSAHGTGKRSGTQEPGREGA